MLILRWEKILKMKGSSLNVLLIKVWLGCISPEPLSRKGKWYGGFLETTSYLIWNWNSIASFIALFLGPALGRFEKHLNGMYSSVFSASAAWKAETKQNCQTDTENRRNSRCGWITVKCRQGQGKKKTIPEPAVTRNFCWDVWWPSDGAVSSTNDKKSFTEYLKTEKMQKMLCSVQRGCQKGAELLDGRWQKRDKAGRCTGTSKTDEDWSATGRWQMNQCITPGTCKGKTLTHSKLREEASLAERHEEPGAWAADSRAWGTSGFTLTPEHRVKPQRGGRWYWV